MAKVRETDPSYQPDIPGSNNADIDLTLQTR
jgi:hypothetical protein